MGKIEFVFSKYYERDKKIDKDLTKDCIQTGRKEKEDELGKFNARKKYEKGELIVVYRDCGDKIFVITAFWNERGKRNDFKFRW